MKSPKLTPGRLIGFLVLLFSLLSSTAIHAQDAAADDEEEIYELSPFQVTAEGNIGYLSNNTLAGTRINSELRNIANAVQVVTKEFLDDVGASDISEVLVYTTNTEAYGVSGNASFGEDQGTDLVQERARREPHLNTRVRGLARADLARDYFLSDVPFHPYNTSEITINRGPNASLFGLGSPGGIINAGVDSANTRKTFGQLDFKFDEFGTVDAWFNYNQVVFEDKLAVRFALLNSRKRYEQKEAFADEERYFAAATWRPLKGMAIRANYERGDTDASRPILTPPKDVATYWFENGKPSYDPYRNEWYINGELVTGAHATELGRASTVFMRAGLTQNGAPIAVFDDPNSPIMGNGGSYGAMQVGLRNNAAGRTSETFPSSGNRVMRKWLSPQRNITKDPTYIAEARPEIPNAARSFYRDPVITDTNIFDYREHSIIGPSPSHWSDFEVYSIVLEQTFFDNRLGFEVSYFDQHWGAYLAESKGLEITPDLNLTLIDGSPNPNYGRPMAGSRGFSQGEVRDRETAQIVAFAKYDFSDEYEGWLRYLGRHSLTSVYRDQKRTNTAPNVWYARADSTWAVGTATSIAQAETFATSPFINGNTRTHVLQYVGPSMANLNSFSEARLTPVTVPQIPHSTDRALKWNPFTSSWEVGPADFFTAQNDFDDMWGFGNNVDVSEIDSFSAVLQSEFLGDHLVTTVSWRTDEVSQSFGQGPRDPATGFFLPVVPEADEFLEPRSRDTTSYGIVAHIPDQWLPDFMGLSLHYVSSENFSAGNTGKDIFNRPGPLTTGVTEEYGFSLAALEGKFYTRVNFFETTSENEVIAGGLTQVSNDIANVMENNSPEELAAAGWDLDTLFKPGFLEAHDFRPQDPNVPNNETEWLWTNIAGSATNHYRDTATEGVEIEVAYSPTPNWRMAFNISSAEVGVSNVMPIAGPELTRIATEIFADPVFGQLWITPDRENTTGEEGRLDSRDDNVLSSIASQQAAEGGPLPEVTKWRWNFVTNYTFREDSRLKGFGIGAGLRWVDKPFIGAELREIDGIYVSDYTKQHYGEEDFNVDAWVTYSRKLSQGVDMRLELRVRGLNQGEGDLIPVRANPDGEVMIYRLGAPMYFEFASRFTF